MSIKLIEDFNNQAIFAEIEQVEKLTRRGIRQGFFAAGKDLKAYANKDILRRPKSGRAYILRRRSGRQFRHIASAPGESHANITGQTRKSLGFQIRGTREMEFGYGVESTGRPATEWGKFLEFGTVKMKPRPSLRNSINANRQNIIQHFESSIDREFKHASG